MTMMTMTTTVMDEWMNEGRVSGTSVERVRLGR